MTIQNIHLREGSRRSLLSPLHVGSGRVLVLGLALLGGCDETAQKMGEASQVSVQPGQVAAAPPAPAIERPIAAYDQCYRGCFAAPTNATNRETCKLECDSLAEDDLGANADLAAREIYQHLRGCFIGCWEDPKLSETNRETCLLTCNDDAMLAVNAPPKQALEVVPGTVLAPGTPLPPGVGRPAPAGVVGPQ